MIIGTTLWIVVISVMSSWGARQRVVLRGNTRRSLLAFGGWGVLYGAAPLVGLLRYPQRPAFWLPAAVIVALPLVLVACWPHERRPQGRPEALVSPHPS